MDEDTHAGFPWAGYPTLTGSSNIRKLGGELRFLAKLVELGATPLYAVWNGMQTNTLIRCPQGHEYSPRPNNLMNGCGGCRTCSLGPRSRLNRPRSARSEAKFLAALNEVGARPDYETWLGAGTAHAVICPADHRTTTTPANVINGCYPCRECRPTDMARQHVARDRFASVVESLGGEVIGEYVNGYTPVEVRCRDGHRTLVHPTSVLHCGQGLCGRCAGQNHDAVYVLTDPKRTELKFGVTSGDPKNRLNDHARQRGLTETLHLRTGLLDGEALRIERMIKAALREAGATPTRGREQFDIEWLPLVEAVLNAAS